MSCIQRFSRGRSVQVYRQAFLIRQVASPLQVHARGSSSLILGQSSESYQACKVMPLLANNLAVTRHQSTAGADLTYIDEASFPGQVV